MGFGRSLFKIGTYAAVFFLGYAAHGCISNDSQYDVRRYQSNPYLVDKKLGEKIPITRINGKMQAGSLEYRVNGVLEDDRLQEYLSRLRGEK